MGAVKDSTTALIMALEQVDEAQRLIAVLADELAARHTLCGCYSEADDVKIVLDGAYTNLRAGLGLPKERG